MRLRRITARSGARSILRRRRPSLCPLQFCADSSDPESNASDGGGRHGSTMVGRRTDSWRQRMRRAEIATIATFLVLGLCSAVKTSAQPPPDHYREHLRDREHRECETEHKECQNDCTTAANRSMTAV